MFLFACGLSDPELEGSGLAAVTAGSAHTCGLSDSGGAYCWGKNDSGQLGLGRDAVGDTVLEPVRVPGHRFKALDAGDSHTCALDLEGAAYCWGFGHLATGVADNYAPKPVLGGHRFIDITAGPGNTCALQENGVVFCWGASYTADGRLPVDVSVGHMFSDLGAGGLFNCAWESKGGWHCWTVGTRRPDTSGVEITLVRGPGFSKLVGGAHHRCGITSQFDAYCWGSNDQGQVGDGTTTRRDEPVAVSGELKFLELGAGWAHTCGLDLSGKAYCWGGNFYGQLGDGSTKGRLTPVEVATDLRFTTITAGGGIESEFGGGYTCARMETGAVYCWGDNRAGQLGDGTTINRFTPVAVLGTTRQ